jgi:hypothetical protein
MAGRRRRESRTPAAPAIGSSESTGWLLFIHQIPPKPAYLRVKIWRRLQKLGAIPLKNSVYVLPAGDQSIEDFQWVRREIVADGGDATICAARLIDGLSDEQVRGLFVAARTAEYEAIVEESRNLAASMPKDALPDPDAVGAIDGQITRLKRRLREAEAIDFFAAPAHNVAEVEVAALERRLRPGAARGREGARGRQRAGMPQNATWVTRAGIHVDRIASAWLIRRFIDPGARFKFVEGKAYRPADGEQRFDMFEAEFTHEGDRCTFEVLLERTGLADPALRAIGEIIHDLDLKDAKYARPETVGLENVLGGVSIAHKDDAVRLERGAAVLDDLYEFFRRQPPASRASRAKN